MSNYPGGGFRLSSLTVRLLTNWAKGGIKTVAALSGRPKMKNLEEPGLEFTKKNKVGTFRTSHVGSLLAMMDENFSKPILAPQTPETTGF